KHSRLGRYFSKYGISAVMSLPITDEVSAHVGPDLRGVLLGMVEVYQRQKRWQDAIPEQWTECLLNCRPVAGQPHVRRPRPQCFWPVDVLILAEQLLGCTQNKNMEV
ncbi:MAG: hypothetical protein ACE5EN_07145, partial [Nitrospinota bacterium]